jgi:lipopolysaccharide export system permease protein
MNLAELHAVLARAKRGDPLRELDQHDPIAYELEIHRRRALPFAPLVFAGMGVPIALASERRNPNRGLFVCLSAALGYYALASLTEIAAREAWLGAGLATWLPNLLFTTLAIGLIAALRNRIPA